jgi:prepilin-type N-terminal cleavage/methylation domain-containing protein
VKSFIDLVDCRDGQVTHLALKFFQTFFGEMKMKSRKGFTLVELMVVILIVGILAAVAIPLMQGRIDKAKWSEANATAGTIRTAVRAYAAETSVAKATTDVSGKALSDAATQGLLGFINSDLDGTYFDPACYTISGINGSGIAEITVAAASSTKTGKPTGTYKLNYDGSWVKQ